MVKSQCTVGSRHVPAFILGMMHLQRAARGVLGFHMPICWSISTQETQQPPARLRGQPPTFVWNTGNKVAHARREKESLHRGGVGLAHNSGTAKSLQDVPRLFSAFTFSGKSSSQGARENTCFVSGGGIACTYPSIRWVEVAWIGHVSALGLQSWFKAIGACRDVFHGHDLNARSWRDRNR